MKTILLIAYAIFLSLTLLLATSGNAATYYVSTSGTDIWSGTSPDSAWRHIAYATKKLKAGDTLIIKSGNYGNEQAEITNSGTAAQPILIKAEIQGEGILTGEGTGTGIFMQDKSHIIIEGIKFTNYASGLCIKYKSTYVTVRKCIFVENNDYGLLLYGWISDASLSHHHIFTENEFYDYTDKQDYGIALYFSTYVKANNNYFFGKHHQALSFKKLMFNSVAANNTFEGFLYSALYLGQNEDDSTEGILRCKNLIAQGNIFRPAQGYRAKRSIMAANVTRAVIRNNFSEGKSEDDGGWGEGIGIDKSSNNIKIYSNVFRTISGTTANPALRFYGDGQGTKVFNNTIVDCAYGLGFEVYAKALFKNNIFYNNGGMIRGSDAADARNCTFEHNEIYPKWNSQDSTNISENPLFVGPFTTLELMPESPIFNPDFSRAEVFRLQSNSPCIEAASFLTKTIAAGNGREINVKDAEYFTDGFGIAEGDSIRIGDNIPVLVSVIDYDNNKITVNRNIIWKGGDGVSLSYYGSKPDIGSYEFNSTSSIHDRNNSTSKSIINSDNYPNPFKLSTTIRFSLPFREHVMLTIFDVLGREVATLVDGEFNPGEHSVVYNSDSLPSGVYYSRLTTLTFFQTKSMVVVK